MLPAYRCSHSLYLILDISSIFFDPFPTFFEKSRSSERLSWYIWFCEQFFYLCLCRNSGMVSSWNPDGFIAFHTMKSCHQIFYGESERMSDMEISSDIWRGNRNIKSLSTFSWLWKANIFFFPDILCSCLWGFWFVLFWEIWHIKKRKINQDDYIYFSVFASGFCQIRPSITKKVRIKISISKRKE